MINGKKELILKTLLNPSAFRIAYVIDLFFASVIFLEFPSLVFRCILLVWGAVILVNKFILNGNILKIKYWGFIVTFLSLGLLTTLIHITDNLLPNLLNVYHMAVCLILFYGMYVERDKESLKKEMLIIFRAIVVITTILSFIGLLLFMFKAQIKLGNFWVGINNNRFIGVYTNSNLLAFSCVMAIIFAHILSKYNEGEYKTFAFSKPLLITSAILNFLSLLLSDSNASFLFIIIYSTVMSFYYLFKGTEKLKARNIIQRSIVLLFMGVTLILVSFAIRDFCQNSISVIVNDFNQIKQPVYDNKPPADVVIGRENYDISYGSGRSVLLIQGWELFKRHPIMGIGRGNLVDYGARYLENGLKYNDLHNGYLTVLVCSGIIGFLVFFIFGVLVASKMCSYLFKNKNENTVDVFSNLFSAIVSYCVYSLFEKTIFTEITFMVIIFWLILGYAMSYMREYIE